MAIAKVCKFQKERKEISYDCGETFEPTQESRKIAGREPVERNSTDCGYQVSRKTVESGYTCNGYDKYTQLVDMISYDGEETWEVISGSSRPGSFVERWSSDCCQLRTVSGTVCTEMFRKANVDIQQASLDGEIWVNTGHYTVNEYLDGYNTDCMRQYGLKFLGVPISGASGQSYFDYQMYTTSVSPSSALTAVGANENYVFIGCESTSNTFVCADDNHNGDSGATNNIRYIYINDCAVNPKISKGSSSKIYNYDSLEKIYISSGVSGSFGICRGLGHRSYEEGWINVAHSSGLTEIVGLGESKINSIGVGMFSDCPNLKYVHIPSTCYFIDGSAFGGCSSVSSVTIDSRYLGDAYSSSYNGLLGQFAGCTSLETVTFPNDYYGLIYKSMFDNCPSLTSVTLGNPSEIRKYAFAGCTSLSAISIGDKVTSIGSNAFNGCSNLKDVYTGKITVPEVWSTTFPSGVTIHVPCEGYLNWHQAFEVEHPDLGVRIAISGDSSCIETRWIESGTTCVGYDKYSRYIEQVRPISGGTWVNTGNESAATLIEADSIDCGGGWQYRWVESGTTCVGYDKWSQSIKQVSYDGGLTWENVSPAEYSATTLLELNSEDCGYEPQTVKLQAYYTDNRADRIECDSTSAITSSEILNLAFPRAEMLEAEIGHCVTSIDGSCFSNCNALSSCTIGSGVTTIGSYGFSGCPLKNINIPDSVTTIGADAFYYCRSLSSCTIGNGVTTIGNEAFYNCSGLTDIIIGSGVTTFGNNAFYNTGHITNLTLYTPTVVKINNWYSYPESITAITLGDNVTTLNESCFSRCTSLTNINISSGITSIPKEAFYYCRSLLSITIPNNITNIGNLAFNYCTSLTNIVIPSGVTFIDDSAFRNCTGLTSFTCLATTPPNTESYESHILDNTGNCPIYVPAASVETYKSARGWWSYADRIQAIPNS